MELELGGHVAVVTGGASGIGWACARMFAREGCRVAVWDISSITNEQRTELATEAGQSHSAIVDLRDFAAVQMARRETEEKLGSVSHLVHAAAIGSGKFGFPFTNLDPTDWLKDQRKTYEEWGTEKVTAVAPLGRWQEPEDVANMVVFLSSPRAYQVTGQTINVDGGQVMHW